MKFGSPLWLLAVPVLVAGLCWLWARSARQSRALLRQVFNTPLLRRLTQSVDPRRRWFKSALLGLGIAALAIALARPQWGRSEIEIERTGVDLVIALDVSRSMLAVDVDATNRLGVAVSAVRRLLSQLGGDRAAVLLFAGESFLSAPLTRDHTAVERAINSADPAMVSAQGSNLGEAIKRARESFDRAAPGPRTLLVISDGEQLQGNAVEEARAALREGVRVHTAGVGSLLGARVPASSSPGSTAASNALGRVVISRADEQHLRRVADAGGGRYTRLERMNDPALAAWFREASSALPRTTEKRAGNEPSERFQWPLAVALILLAAEWVMSDRKRANILKTT